MCNFRLFLEIAVLPFYILWFICLGKFIVDTPLEEIPHKQPQTIFFSVWFLTLVYHGAVCYRDDRIPVLLEVYRGWKYSVREYVLQYLVGTFLWDFLRILHLPQVCIMANAAFELCFVVCTSLAGVAVFHYSICNMDESFYSHNLFFLILYGALRVRLRDLYDVGKLVGHFAYACLHLGCIGEHLGYPGSYYAINVGVVVFTLLVAWTWLNAESSGDEPYGGGDAPDSPGVETRRGHGASSESQPDDAELSPKSPQWKPKVQKRKKKR